MNKANILAKAPSKFFSKPLTVDVAAIFKALGKGVAHTAAGKWAELGVDAVDALASIGVSKKPDELAFVLIKRALISSLFALFEDNIGTVFSELHRDAEEAFKEISRDFPPTYIDDDFMRRPGQIEVIAKLSLHLSSWFDKIGVSKSAADNIVARLPIYFTYALSNEWRKNANIYQVLKDSINTPFSMASEREWAWAEYSTLLRKRAEESVFDESFSLSQIYVPLNAYFVEDGKDRDALSDNQSIRKRQKRHVVSLEGELKNWLSKKNSQDTIRVISGGPGSGKSSFAKIFSAEISEIGEIRVLFIPLHLIDPLKDIVSEVGRFVREERILTQNPLDPEDPEANLLVIFDGLDELSSQGKAAAETARSFVREIERLSHRLNFNKVRVRILLSGREVVVQENESEFRGPRQILTILPYLFKPGESDKYNYHSDIHEYIDNQKILSIDFRNQWWEKYGKLTGKVYDGLPEALNRPDLSEVTGQPLLNYLIALSFSRKKIDFTGDLNLNSVYADLVAAVHERGYEKHRSHVQIRDMKAEEFSRVLEEVGLAAWHGDGRTTTVNEIEQHCKSSGLEKLLSLFQEGAKAGVTRLLAAFFFRQHGQRSGGEPTFVFTHKSFGEYLTSRRIIRAVDRISKELSNRFDSPDMGWDERDALRHWGKITGPSSISPYLHDFLLSEISLRNDEQLKSWQDHLNKLFSYVLKHGMPMEQVNAGATFKDLQFYARNSEEALLVLLNACARITKITLKIDQQDPTTFGAWFRRIQGQRSGPESSLAAKCLSYIDLSGACLDIGDFYGADFNHAILHSMQAHYTCFIRANFSYADLREANLSGALVEDTSFRHAKLAGAFLLNTLSIKSNLAGADLTDVDLPDDDEIRRKQKMIQRVKRSQQSNL